MEIGLASICFVQWFPVPDILRNAQGLAAPFLFLASPEDDYPPSGLPVLKPLGKVVPLGRGVLQTSPHTAKFWDILRPHLPVQVVPALGLSYSRTGPKVSDFQFRALLNSFGIVTVASFEIEAEPPANAAQLPRLLTNIERGDSKLKIACNAFRNSRGLNGLFRAVRNNLVHEILPGGVTALPYGIEPFRSFCVLMLHPGSLPASPDEWKGRDADKLAIYSILERVTGNQEEGDASNLDYRSYLDEGREAGTGVPSGWIFGSINGLAAYIREGRSAKQAARARECHFHNLATVVGLYRLHHSWLAAVAQTGEEVEPDFIRHAGNVLARMNVEYPKWWVRWGSARLKLRNEIKDLIARHQVDGSAVPAGAREVFVSYAHEDKKYVEQLEVMLAPAIRNGEIVLRVDTSIEPGAEWEARITRWMTTASVAVLFVSADFLNSTFIAEKELPELLRASQSRGLQIFWVLVSPGLWRQGPLGALKSFSDTDHPWDSLSEPQVRQELNRLAEAILPPLRVAAWPH